MCDIIAHEKSSQFLNFLTLVKSMHSYNTRFASNLNFSRPSARTNYGVHTIKYATNGKVMGTNTL